MKPIGSLFVSCGVCWYVFASTDQEVFFPVETGTLLVYLGCDKNPHNIPVAVFLHPQGKKLMINADFYSTMGTWL